jgi:FkbM family methyltransferase
MFSVYKRYPFPVPLRVKFFNLFRLPFLIPAVESFLVARLDRGSVWWRKFIPPSYFYPTETMRVTKREGFHYQVDLSKLIDHSIYFCTDKEVTWKVLLSVLRPGYHVIDAGANIGYLTLHFARRCKDGHVYSFEPDQKNFVFLQENVRLNHFENQVTIFKKALGETRGTATLYRVDSNNPGANRILPTPPESKVPSEPVEIVTVDELNDQGIFRNVDLIKIDVEGFEVKVLKGAVRLIQQWKPILFVELAEVNLNQQNETAETLVTFIQNLGYQVWDARTLRPVDFTLRNHTDIICVPLSQDLKSILTTP